MPAVLEGTPALEDVLMVEDAKKRRLTRRKSVDGGSGSATPRKETETDVRGDVIFRAGSKKEARRFQQKHHTADGQHHQAVSEDRTGNEVIVRSHLRHGHHGHGARRSEVHKRTDASVQRGSRGSGQRPHTGTTTDLGMGRLDCGSPEAGNGARDGTIMDTKCDHARFCRVDRTCQSEQARMTQAVDRSGVRDPVVNAFQQLGGARKYGRALPAQLCRTPC